MKEFKTALEALGFTSEAQQIAATKIIHFSGLFRGDPDVALPEKLMGDFETRAFIERSEAIDAETVLDMLNDGMQAQMKRRTAERQQIAVDPRLEAERAEVIALLDVMGFISEVKPTKEVYDGARVLGAAQGGVTGRINEMEALIESGVRPKEIFLFGSGRPLWPNAEAVTLEFVSERIVAAGGGELADVKAKVAGIFTEALIDLKPEQITPKRKEIVEAFRKGEGIAAGLPPIE